MAKPTICTIFTKPTLAHARTLADSFFEQHPEGHMVALLVDEIDGYFDSAVESFEIMPVESLDISGFPAMTMRYDQQELCAAVKPYFLDYLLHERGCERVCYFDPTIAIHAPLDDLFALLETKLMVLIPHLLDPLAEDRFQPDERTILQQGAYNSGFLGLAQHPDCERFLRWWQQPLPQECSMMPEQGRHLRQRRLNLAPTLFADVHIHREPSWGVGYWNLGQRSPQKSEAGYLVKDAPLVFFHHSGFQVDNIESISKNQNRFTLSDFSQLHPLFTAYQEALLNNDYRTIKAWPYAYDFFDNRVPIPDLLRQLWRTPGIAANWPEPRRTHQDTSFLAWLNESEHRLRELHLVPCDGTEDAPMPLITNLAIELYRLYPEWQRRFPNPLRGDREAFARYFVDYAVEEGSIHNSFVEPVRATLQKVPNYPFAEVYQRMQSWVAQWITDAYIKESWAFKLYATTLPLLNRLRMTRYFEETVRNELSQDLMLQPQAHRGKVLHQQVEPNLPIGINMAGALRNKGSIGQSARDMIAGFLQHEAQVAQMSLPSAPADIEPAPILEQLPVGNPYPFNLIYLPVSSSSLQPIFGEQYFQNKYTIGFLWWEFEQIPPPLIRHFNTFHEIWAGSHFLRNTFAATSTVPVMHMELPIPPIAPPTLSRSDLGLPEDKHIFLYVFGAGSRKNPLAAIRAYREAFAPHFDDTLLILKTHGLDRYPEEAQQVRTELEGVSGLLLEEYMPRDQANALFHACDSYVSLHRAEGLGLTMAEAMQLGKSVIATGYSGNMDFMTPENSYPVSYQLIELKEDADGFAKGFRWADPNIEEAASYMQRVVNCPEEARRKGDLAQQCIQHRYDVGRATKKMLTRLETIQTHLYPEQRI